MDTVDWRQARQWLIDTGVIPPTHRVTKPDVTLLDFARSLRDGVFLCSLLNKLKPGTVEYTARPVMQHSYLHNINAFLNACKLEFKIIEDDLFTDSELYDVDNFSKVMSTLSKLSYTQEALSRGWKPFPSDDNRDYYNDPSNGQDIYASLQDVSAQTAVYANVSDLYQDTFTEDDSYGYGDEKIYDSVLRYQAKPLTEANTQDEQRLAILKELYETEKSFSEVLQVIAKDYYEILKDHCTEDLKVLFGVAQKLLPFHRQLRDGIEKCTNPKPNSGDTDIATCFFDVEEGFLEYGTYAAVLPEATEKARLLQNQRDTSRLMQSTMDKSQSRFPLSDILPVPIQRIMRYPLLIKELEKCAKKASLQSQVMQMERLLSLLEDIAKYINITKGDYDTVRTIEELESNLVDYKGPKLSQCGRYHMDGELRIKYVDGGKDKEEPKSRWVFLFDKIILITNRRQRFLGVRYIVKSYHDVAAVSVETVSAVRSRSVMFAFRLKVADGKGGVSEAKEYMAVAKTEQLKLMWTEAVKKARDIIRPVAGKKSHHSFEYHNFDSAKKCSCCQKLLHGSYFQGYLCSECGVVSHRDCLSSQPTCSAARHPRLPLHSPLMPQNSLDTGIKRITRTRDATEPIIPTGTKRTYVATQRYIPFGHRRDTYLSFEKGDEIDITINNDPEKWEGIHCRSGMKGFLSPHYLIRKPQIQILPSVSLPGNSIPDPNPSPRNKRMSEYAWYIGRKTRIDAEVALHRQRDGVFLIRESMDRPGEYAVALRWNNMPKHIKIMKNFQTDKLYVSDACDFSTIPELVEYYHKNTLGQSFPGVDTTLKYSYLDVMEGRAAFERERRHHSLTSTSGAGLPPPSFPAPQPLGHIPPPTMSPPSHSMNSWSNDILVGEALCDFNGEGQGQLSFLKHDVVRVVTKDTKKLGWWHGESNGRTGIFRADHIYIKETMR